MFLLAERNGELRKAIAGAGAAGDSQTVLVATIHDIIHETRDSLLAEDAFLSFLAQQDGDAPRRLFEIWQSQLGMIQKGMRSITGSDCNICIKLLKKDAFDKGVDGLVTVCYSPAVSIERRKRSCILPTNQGIAQEAVVTKNIAFSNDILTDDRFWPRERKEECAKHYRTVLSAPIIVDRTVRGVLCFDWPAPSQFAPSHRHAVACFTDLVSTACYFNELARKLSSEYKPNPKL
jgi:GAF domain-containing protein